MRRIKRRLGFLNLVGKEIKELRGYLRLGCSYLQISPGSDGAVDSVSSLGECEVGRGDSFFPKAGVEGCPRNHSC